MIDTLLCVVITCFIVCLVEYIADYVINKKYRSIFYYSIAGIFGVLFIIVAIIKFTGGQ